MNKFCYYSEKGFFWFRIFGYGLVFKNLKTHKMLFSERYKYCKCLKIGNLLIRVLKNDHFYQNLL